MKIRTNISIVALLVSLLFGYTVQASQYIAYSLKVAQQRIEEAGLNWRNKEPEVLNLGRINHVEGFVYDKESGDLILVGQDEEGRAPLTLDDLVVALRARFRNHEWPRVSIDPTEDTIQKVRFKGGIGETAFGQSLFDAGYQLEQMGMGLVEPGIPGLKTCWDRCIENLEKGIRQYQCNINSRFWFYPINPYVVVRDGVCVVRGLKVGVFTEVLSQKINGEEVKDLKGFKFEETIGFAILFFAILLFGWLFWCNKIEPGIQKKVAKAMLNKGVAIGEVKGPAAEIAIYDELDRRYGQSTEPEIQVQGAKAMYSKGMSLFILEKPKDAIALFDELEKRYGQSTEPGIQKVMAMAMFNKGLAVLKVKGPEAAIPIYDELEKRYGQSTEPGIQEQVALAMVGKGLTIGEVKGPEAAIAIYDEVEKRYGKSTELGIQELVASAMVNKGLAVGKVKGPEAAIAIFDEIEKRYGKSTEPEIQVRVASAMYYKGVAVGIVKGPEAAIAIFDELEKRYGQSTEPEIQVRVVKAMYNRGVAVLKVKGPEAAIVIYDELEKRYGQSTEPGIQKVMATAMHNKGVALFELRRYDEARKALEKADKLGDPDARRLLEQMKRLGK